MAEQKYPECEKLAAVSQDSRVMGAFLEWLRDSKRYEFAKWGENEDGEDILLLVHTNIEPLLAEYFEIDMNKVERERQQILEDIRK